MGSMVLVLLAGTLAAAAAFRPAALVDPHQSSNPTPTPINPAIHVLWNFTTVDNVSEWVESSDGNEQGGKSTGAFKLQITANFQRAVMFSLLNPTPTGAGYVGFYALGQWDFSQYKTINVTCRGQGQGLHYKVYMNTKTGPQRKGGSYESYFELPDDTFITVSLPLSSFQYYYLGQIVDDAPPLDTSSIYRIALQIYAGFHKDYVRQRGASSLEIDSITVGP